MAIIQAFSEDHVARLTGLTVNQLRHWDRTGFFTPSFADPNRKAAFSRIYSFLDIASLRVLSILRSKGVSLQHLRKVSDKLSHLGESRWTKTTLYVMKKNVVFLEPETQKPREILSGQYTFEIRLMDVSADVQKAIEALHRRDDSKVGKIERNRWVAHNAYVIAGTRIPVSAIKNFHDAGYSDRQILREYPDISQADIKAALAHKEKEEAA
jgi:DNA-binding transcriptional MerR regulator